MIENNKIQENNLSIFNGPQSENNVSHSEPTELTIDGMDSLNISNLFLNKQMRPVGMLLSYIYIGGDTDEILNLLPSLVNSDNELLILKISNHHIEILTKKKFYHAEIYCLELLVDSCQLDFHIFDDKMLSRIRRKILQLHLKSFPQKDTQREMTLELNTIFWSLFSTSDGKELNIDEIFDSQIFDEKINEIVAILSLLRELAENSECSISTDYKASYEDLLFTIKKKINLLPEFIERKLKERSFSDLTNIFKILNKIQDNLFEFFSLREFDFTDIMIDFRKKVKNFLENEISHVDNLISTPYLQKNHFLHIDSISSLIKIIKSNNEMMDFLGAKFVMKIHENFKELYEIIFEKLVIEIIELFDLDLVAVQKLLGELIDLSKSTKIISKQSYYTLTLFVDMISIVLGKSKLSYYLKNYQHEDSSLDPDNSIAEINKQEILALIIAHMHNLKKKIKYLPLNDVINNEFNLANSMINEIKKLKKHYKDEFPVFYANLISLYEEYIIRIIDDMLDGHNSIFNKRIDILKFNFSKAEKIYGIIDFASNTKPSSELEKLKQKFDEKIKTIESDFQKEIQDLLSTIKNYDFLSDKNDPKLKISKEICKIISLVSKYHSIMVSDSYVSKFFDNSSTIFEEVAKLFVRHKKDFIQTLRKFFESPENMKDSPKMFQVLYHFDKFLKDFSCLINSVLWKKYHNFYSNDKVSIEPKGEQEKNISELQTLLSNLNSEEYATYLAVFGTLHSLYPEEYSTNKKKSLAFNYDFLMKSPSLNSSINPNLHKKAFSIFDSIQNGQNETRDSGWINLYSTQAEIKNKFILFYRQLWKIDPKASRDIFRNGVEISLGYHRLTHYLGILCSMETNLVDIFGITYYIRIYIPNLLYILSLYLTSKSDSFIDDKRLIIPKKLLQIYCYIQKFNEYFKWTLPILKCEYDSREVDFCRILKKKDYCEVSYKIGLYAPNLSDFKEEVQNNTFFKFKGIDLHLIDKFSRFKYLSSEFGSNKRQSKHPNSDLELFYVIPFKIKIEPDYINGFYFYEKRIESHRLYEPGGILQMNVDFFSDNYAITASIENTKHHFLVNSGKINPFSNEKGPPTVSFKIQTLSVEGYNDFKNNFIILEFDQILAPDSRHPSYNDGYGDTDKEIFISENKIFKNAHNAAIIEILTEKEFPECECSEYCKTSDGNEDLNFDLDSTVDITIEERNLNETRILTDINYTGEELLLDHSSAGSIYHQEIIQNHGPLMLEILKHYVHFI